MESDWHCGYATVFAHIWTNQRKEEVLYDNPPCVNIGVKSIPAKEQLGSIGNAQVRDVSTVNEYWQIDGSVPEIRVGEVALSSH